MFYIISNCCWLESMTTAIHKYVLFWMFSTLYIYIIMSLWSDTGNALLNFTSFSHQLHTVPIAHIYFSHFVQDPCDVYNEPFEWHPSKSDWCPAVYKVRITARFVCVFMPWRVMFSLGVNEKLRVQFVVLWNQHQGSSVMVCNIVLNLQMISMDIM